MERWVPTALTCSQCGSLDSDRRSPVLCLPHRHRRHRHKPFWLGDDPGPRDLRSQFRTNTAVESGNEEVQADPESLCSVQSCHHAAASINSHLRIASCSYPSGQVDRLSLTRGWHLRAWPWIRSRRHAPRQRSDEGCLAGAVPYRRRTSTSRNSLATEESRQTIAGGATANGTAGGLGTGAAAETSRTDRAA